MKTILTSLLIFLFIVKMYAQQSPERIQLELNAEKAQKMKTGGAVLVVLGSILVISGGVTIANNFDLWSDENDDKAKTGAILFAFGAASLGAGIPLTIVGSHKQRKYRNQLDAISVRANFSPQHRGVGLTYRF